MAFFVELPVGVLTVCDLGGTGGKIKVYTGVAANRAAVRALVDTAQLHQAAPIGSIFVAKSAAGAFVAVYVKVAAAGADADWYKVTATNAD